MNKVSPFTPGDSGMPPYLAGRETEQAVFTAALDELKAGKPNRGIVMYGPRGMGKTVLLRWFEAQCQAQGVTAAVLYPEQGELPITKFTPLLPATAAPKQVTPKQVTVGAQAGVDLGVKALGAFNVTWQAADKSGEGNLESHLHAACEQSPRALLIDEAHTLDKGVCQGLLAMAQSLINKAPLLFIMAGTPGLMPYLNTVGATYVSRSEKIGVGALSAQAAADAIRVPLREEGVAITEDALAMIVEDSQRYPFFLQEWGMALWGAVAAGQATEVTRQAVESVSHAMQEKREGFYAERYRGMRENEALLTAANAIAKAFRGKDSLSIDAVIFIIRKALAATIADADARRAKASALEQELNRIDYFWYPPDGKARPGIPSFMDYISERHAEMAALERGLE